MPGPPVVSGTSYAERQSGPTWTCSSSSGFIPAKQLAVDPHHSTTISEPVLAGQPVPGTRRRRGQGGARGSGSGPWCSGSGSAFGPGRAPGTQIRRPAHHSANRRRRSRNSRRGACGRRAARILTNRHTRRRRDWRHHRRRQQEQGHVASLLQRTQSLQRVGVRQHAADAGAGAALRVPEAQAGEEAEAIPVPTRIRRPAHSTTHRLNSPSPFRRSPNRRPGRGTAKSEHAGGSSAGRANSPRRVAAIRSRPEIRASGVEVASDECRAERGQRQQRVPITAPATTTRRRRRARSYNAARNRAGRWSDSPQRAWRRLAADGRRNRRPACGPWGRTC